MIYFLEHMTSDSIDLNHELTENDIVNYAKYYSREIPTDLEHAIRLLNEEGWNVFVK